MSSSVTLENSPRHRGGWTNIDPRPTTVEIFVDATGGDDANDGLSEGNAVETIGAGYALLRDGYPDHLCLKRGEEWTASLGQSSGDLWNKSGAGPDDPMIVKPYGTGARPKIIKQSQGIRIEGNASVTVEDFQIHGIEFEPSSETGRGTCIWIISTVTRFLMEDCHIHGYVSNVTIQAGSYSDETGPHTDVALRRNVITDAHPDSGHSQGCFIADSRNVLLEGNILDSNGLDGAAGGGGGGGTLFNHNFYIANSNKRVVSRENVSVRSSSYGLMQRPGGRIERNLFIECPHAILFGSHESSQLTRWPDGIDCFGRDNVILDGTYRSGVGSGGLGIQTEEVRRALIENNLVARYDTGLSGSPGAIYHDAINGGGTNDTIVRANITYEWESGMKLTVGTKCDGVRWIDNHL
ncbi:MAG: hypothetical protein ACPGWS_04035, partial [Solirubrobacterales bacterium]